MSAIYEAVAGMLEDIGFIGKDKECTQGARFRFRGIDDVYNSIHPLLAKYKAAGGGYKGRKSPQNALVRWTKQDWRTKSGRPSSETGERYLPAKAIKALTPSEYASSTRAKRRSSAKREQYSRQPSRIAKKTAKYRR